MTAGDLGAIPRGRPEGLGAPRIAAAVLMATVVMAAGAAVAADAPKPRPKPDAPGGSGPAAEQREPASEVPKVAPAPATGEPSRPEPGRAPTLVVEQPPFDEAAAKACEAELTALGVRFVVREAIADEGGCGARRPVEASAIGTIDLRPPVVARCEVARALGRWVAEVVRPSAVLYLGEEPAALTTAGSYQCRARAAEAVTVSEHARANAVDLSGAEFAGRGGMTVRDWTGVADPLAAFQAAIRGGACAYFTTVLGPGTDPDHADHLHLDLEARKTGTRLCQ